MTTHRITIIQAHGKTRTRYTKDLDRTLELIKRAYNPDHVDLIVEEIPDRV